MRKLQVLLLVLVFLSLCTQKSRASHLLGGEITWKCEPLLNGNFIFTLKLYRACSGISLGTTEIIRNPLYVKFGGPANITVSQISSRDLSPPCYDSTLNLDCYDSTKWGNAIEEKVYRSTPILLKGYPDKLGSDFVYTSCCRPDSVSVRNLRSTNASYYLRSVMYPYRNPLSGNIDLVGDTIVNTGLCYDSSPQFAAAPAANFCARRNNIYQHLTNDADLDSIVYSWSTPAQAKNYKVKWRADYSGNNQLPSKIQDTNNVPGILDTVNGIIYFKTYNPIGGYHSIGVKATSYRHGQRIAEVFRDIVITILNCDDTISKAPLVLNNKPKIEFKEVGVSAPFSSTFSRNLAIGESLELDIKVEDFDSLNTTPKVSQSVSLEVFGVSMSVDVNDSVNCLYPPCAYLDAVGNPSWKPLKNIFIDSGQAVVRFKWTAQCIHLRDYQNIAQARPWRTFYFMVRSRDNWCPIPNENDKVFKINVYDSTGLNWPITQLDASSGLADMKWKPYLLPRFKSYIIYRSNSFTGPKTTALIETNPLITGFIDTLTNTNSASVNYLLKVNPGVGCLTSYDVRTIHLKVDTVGKYDVNLKWNKPYYNNPFFKEGKYFIYRSDTLGPFTLLDSLDYGTTSYKDESPPYNQFVKYKIECFERWGLYSISNIDSLKIDSLAVIPGAVKHLGELNWSRIYPNPVKDILYFEHSETKEKMSVSIYGISGSLWDSFTFSSGRNEMDVNKLPPGIYYLKCNVPNHSSEYHKFVKR